MSAALRKSLQWSAPKIGVQLPIQIFYRESSNAGRRDPVIVYVMNHRAERIGQEPDASILQDYLEQRFIVVTVDFKNHPLAYSPCFDEDLLALHRALDGTKGAACIFEGTGLSIDAYDHYFLPAGYRLQRNLGYFALDQHGSCGTVEKVVEVWNNTLFPRGKVPRPIHGPDELRTPAGSTLD